MSVKETVLEAIQNLPADATWEDVAERFRFLHAIDAGLREVAAGRTLPHEQVKTQLEQWLA
jgi:predicted transcriptional regulator